MNVINEVDKPIVKKTVVVYAGRFQPFHKGHYAAYSKLVSKFGKDNVYIGTSNDTSGPKSPFNFNEKKKIATTMFGIPANRFIQIKNPYKPVEILKGFDGQTTQYIAAVGEKDATRLQGKYFKAYNGKAGYGYDEIGYVYPVPAEKDPISGTDVRNYLGGDDIEKAKGFFLKAYPKFNQEIFNMITDKIKSKQMQSLSEYGAMTMGTATAGSFGQNPLSNKDDEDELKEDGLPGGSFTGLVSPGGYINGAPKPKDVNKLSNKLHKGDDEDTHKKYVYDPISEIIYNFVTEEMFEEFLSNYFNEAKPTSPLSKAVKKSSNLKKSDDDSNPLMDKDIKYKKADGTDGTMKVKAALRMPKDHQAHIEAEKILGKDKPKGDTGTEKEGGEDTDSKKDKKPGDEKGAEEKGATDKAKGETEKEPKKLGGDELKTDAEKSPEEIKKAETAEYLKKVTSKLSPEDQQSVKNMNDLDSPERKEMKKNGEGFLRKLGRKLWNNISGFAVKKSKQIWNTIGGLVSLVRHGGKLGVVKDKNGKKRHFKEFCEKDENGDVIEDRVPDYVQGRKPEPGQIHPRLKKSDKDEKSGFYKDPDNGKLYDLDDNEVDHHGNVLDKETGQPIQKKTFFGKKPKFKKEPRLRKDLSEEEKELAHKSMHKKHDQLHAIQHTLIDGAILAGSVVAGHAIAGGIKAATAGGAAHGAATAAAHGAASTAAHGASQTVWQGAVAGVKHIAHEGLTGIAKTVGTDLAIHSGFEALGMKALPAGGATTVVSAAMGILAESKGKHSTDGAAKFMDAYVKRIVKIMIDKKLTDEQLIKSIEKYNKNKTKDAAKDSITSLMNTANKTITEEVVSKTKVQNIADFVGYSLKRLKLKDKPNIKLILGQQYSEQNGSLGGYSPETKDIYVVVPKRMTADICRTIAHELVHRKQDEMGYINNSGIAGKTGSPIENQANAIAGILLRDYGKMNKEIYSEGLITENMSDSATSDQPTGAYLPAKHKRVLGGNDGVNKSDFWFHNGGYIQIEFPEADSMLGDREANQVYIKYVTKNVPRESGPKTKFTTNPDKVNVVKKNTDYDFTKGALEKVLSEVSTSNLHFKNIYKHWRDGSAKEKQAVAALVTGNSFANQKEFVRELTRLTKREIKEIENVIGIKIDKINNEVYGGEPGGWYGSGAKRSVDGWVDDGENDYTDTSRLEDINIDVNTGDEVLMGKFKNKKVKVKDIGKDKHGMPTINSKQATTFRTINEGNYIVGGMQDDQSFRSPYTDKWERFDDRAQTHAEIIGYKVIGHTSDHYPQKKKGVVLPSKNPSEENGPGKRWIHPSKGEEYANDKKEKWEMYPFNSRPQAYAPPPAVGTQIDIFKYTKPKVIKENIEEWNQLLLEGGAYGHMSHPFDDMDLTFGDLKNIISKALDGDLGVVREKTDGQALAISWKGGRLIAARNKGHLENAGANAMGIEDVASKFAGRGGLTDAYNFAMHDLSTAIAGLSKGQRDKIFNEGKCFMNIEVIWPTSVNVIPYGQALLVFHNTTCYDEKGKAIGADQSAARTLAGMIKQINADVQSKYTIQGPPITSIPKNSDLSSKKGSYLQKLSKLQHEFGLSDSDSVAMYHQSWWENFIDKKAPIKVDKITKEALVKRWAFGDKSFKLNTISNKELVNWSIDTDKTNVQKQQKENIKPFEEIFLGVGADVLEFVSSVLTVYPDKAIRNMKDRLKSTANQVRKAGNPAQIQKLKTELERLNKLGGIDKIVAVEGLVFFYNGKTYKLTGTFAPLNQILGIFYG